MSRVEKGFAAVEAVLILIVLGLLGGTGYYVWHSNQQTKATLDSASKVAQSSPVKQEDTKLSDTFAGDPNKHAQLNVPTDWAAKTLATAGSGKCSFEAPLKDVEDTCLVNIELSSKSHPDTSSVNFKVFQTSDNPTAWRSTVLGTGCKATSPSINGYATSFCAAGNTQSYSDYLISDGHYLVDIISYGKGDGSQVNAMVHSLKITD